MSEQRKRRTREHVIADMSRVHVEMALVRAGFTIELTRYDYGYDLSVSTYDKDGYVEPGEALIQLKATDTIERGARAGAWAFDVKVADYNLWKREPSPVFLVLYDASQSEAYWLYVQQYFAEDSARKPRKGAKQVRVWVPKSNVVDQEFARYLHEQKSRILEQMEGAIDHAT